MAFADPAGGGVAPTVLPPRMRGKLLKNRPNLQWGGRQFTNMAQFRPWLQKHGGNMEQFLRKHPHAAAILQGRGGPQFPAPAQPGGPDLYAPGAPVPDPALAGAAPPPPPGPPVPPGLVDPALATDGGAPVPPGAVPPGFMPPGVYDQKPDPYEAGPLTAASLAGGNRRFTDTEDQYSLLKQKMDGGLLGGPLARSGGPLGQRISPRDPMQNAMMKMARKYMSKRGLMRGAPGPGARGLGRRPLGGPMLY